MPDDAAALVVPNIQFNVKAIDATTGQPVTAPLVVRIDAGLSGTVRNTNPANFYFGPPKVPAWVGDVEVVAAGYAPWSTGADPQITFGTADVEVVAQLVPFRKAFQPAPRFWNAQMSGIRVPGLPFVPGMEGTPAGLFFSWFYDDRYDATWRQTIRAQMKAQGYTHWLMSWPDSGATPERFRELCRELTADGFFPCVMLSSKDFSPHDVPGILANLAPLLPLLVGVVPMFCIGWELSLWLSPTQVQQLIDAIAPVVLAQPGTLLYVHFQAGYASFQQNGQFFAAFWNRNVGQLTGVLHQRLLEQTKNQYQFDSGGLYDVLVRFAGGAGCSADSGFGHPFDLVALEITAMLQAYSGMSEAEGNTWGDTAISTPPVNGPLGPVAVMGSGNGRS